MCRPLQIRSLSGHAGAIVGQVRTCTHGHSRLYQLQCAVPASGYRRRYPAWNRSALPGNEAILPVLPYGAVARSNDGRGRPDDAPRSHQFIPTGARPALPISISYSRKGRTSIGVVVADEAFPAHSRAVSRSGTLMIVMPPIISLLSMNGPSVTITSPLR
jgi:hypothetical protein